MTGHGLVVQFGQNRLGQLLAQLHAPLIEGVDVPDHALRKDLVFVHRHQAAERARRQLREQNGVGRLVAGKGLVRDQLLQR